MEDTKVMWYILDEDKNVIPAKSNHEGMLWYEKTTKSGERVVKVDKIGDTRVSTVFLGLDHGWNNSSPVVFETMIFGGEHDENQWRYTTWNEAVEGHKKACELVINSKENENNSSN